jgi:hypothetical protein
MATLSFIDAAFCDPVRVSRPDRHTLVEVRAVGGIEAGRVWSLGMGTHTLGPALDSAVVLRGGRGGLHGAKLTVTADGTAWLAFPGPQSAPDGPRLRQLRPEAVESIACGGRELRWPEGAELSLCGSVLTLVRPKAPKSKRADSDLARIEQAMLLERAARCAEAPDPAALAVDAVGRGTTVWQAKPADEARLRLRLGSSEGASRAHAAVSNPGSADAVLAGRWILPGLPHGVDLNSAGVLGVCGEPGAARALARWLVVQATTRCAPENLSIRVFADPTSTDSWNWAGRLPHIAAQRGAQPPASYAATDPQHVGRGIGELVAEIESRSSFRQPEILAVFDRASILRQVDGVTGILAKGPEVGVYAICIDSEDKLVPECRALVRCSPDELTLIALRETEQQGGIVPDLVAPTWCERVAVAVAARGSAA